jgi:hypothetical protein
MKRRRRRTALATVDHTTVLEPFTLHLRQTRRNRPVRCRKTLMESASVARIRVAADVCENKDISQVVANAVRRKE